MEMLNEGEYARLNSIDMLLSELEKEKPRPFSYEQLKSFTSDFKFKIGSGGFGDVYEGKLPDGVKIAVKVLRNNNRDVMEKLFESEVGTVGRTYHPNLIKLYGYCNGAKILALIYEYMENGSFDKILFKNHLDIPWVKLYDIAIGIAKGISYLHESSIVHHDIKPGNVLIDSKLSPKVIDFGLARVNVESSQFSQSGMRGTPGYAAPEVFMGPQVKISSKCDVFSFGMMLFNILGSKRNSESKGWLPGEVWKHYEKKLLDKYVMECGIGEDDEEDAMRLSVIALLCAQHDPRSRPSMSTVVKMLEDEILPWTPVNPFIYYESLNETETRRGRRRQPRSTSTSAYTESLGEKSSVEVVVQKKSSSSSISTWRPPLQIPPVDLEKKSSEIDSRQRTLDLTSSIQGELKDHSKVSIFPNGSGNEANGSDSMLESYQIKCPPGGENSVIVSSMTNVNPRDFYPEGKIYDYLTKLEEDRNWYDNLNWSIQALNEKLSSPRLKKLDTLWYSGFEDGALKKMERTLLTIRIVVDDIYQEKKELKMWKILHRHLKDFLCEFDDILDDIAVRAPQLKQLFQSQKVSQHPYLNDKLVQMNNLIQELDTIVIEIKSEVLPEFNTRRRNPPGPKVHRWS